MTKMTTINKKGENTLNKLKKEFEKKFVPVYPYAGWMTEIKGTTANLMTVWSFISHAYTLGEKKGRKEAGEKAYREGFRAGKVNEFFGKAWREDRNAK